MRDGQIEHRRPLFCLQVARDSDSSSGRLRLRSHRCRGNQLLGSTGSTMVTDEVNETFAENKVHAAPTALRGLASAW